MWVVDVDDLWYVVYKTTGQRRQAARHGKGARWQARWRDPAGRQHKKAFAKKSDAERYLAKLHVDMRVGAYVGPELARTTVGQWCDTWMAGYARRGSTVRQAGVHLAQIRAEFGALPLAAVRPSRVRSWLARLQADGYSPSYVDALHRRLSQLMSAAVDDGMIARSPCSRRTAPGAPRQRPYVATTEQVWALHGAMPDLRLQTAVLLGAFAGLRASEACGLRVSDVDFLRAVIHPVVQARGEPLKTEMSRTPVPIARGLAEALSAYVARTGGDTILAGAAGEPLTVSTLDKAMRQTRGGVDGLPAGFRYQDLRHYFASLLISSGADVKVVQARLRHTSATTTLNTYGHLWPDSDESTRAAVQAVFAARRDVPTMCPQRAGIGQKPAQ
jgi:integrase